MAASSDSNHIISAWNLVFSFVPAMALKCALLLEIPDIISRAGPGPNAIAALSIPDIAARVQKPPDLNYLSRLMRYLSGIGVFSEMEINGEIVYGLTEMTKMYFVRDSNPANLATFHLFMNDEVSQAAWHREGESAVEGGNAFQIAHGRDIYDYANHDARYNRLVNEGMLSYTLIVIKDVMADYDGFKDVTTLVDIAGGVGGALTEIMAVYPHIQGINFDLPHVIAAAPRNRIPGIGIQHVAGDMFESIPSADAALIMHSLNDWDDQHCIKILKNCFKALSEKGKLILVEDIMNSSQPLQVVDLLIHAITNSGRLRSQQQWVKLLSESGFKINRIIGKEDNIWKTIEAIKISNQL